MTGSFSSSEPHYGCPVRMDGMGGKPATEAWLTLAQLRYSQVV